jgi:hypothetical protein
MLHRTHLNVRGLLVEEKTLLLHAWRTSLESANLALRACTASSPWPTKNRPLPWSAEKDKLGRLIFIATEPHFLGGGGGQHRGRWLGTWSRGFLRAEPPPRVAGHPYKGDKEAIS